MEPSEPLTIVLLGHTGAGKSASGNTILGCRAFESKPSFSSVTKDICEKNKTVFGKQVSVIDTPGILGSEKTIKDCCQKVLQSRKACLFLVVVSVGRFTDEQEMAVRTTIEALGDDGLSKSYVLFTNGDDLKTGTVDDFISEDDESSLPGIVETFAGKYHLFNNESGGQEQVRQLLIKSGYLESSGQKASRVCGHLPDIRIVLLGLSGGGKSSSGNTILGSETFKSDCNFDSGTTEIVSASAEVEGYKVTVVDTPGFSDEVLTPKQLFDKIKETFVTSRPGPHAFLVVAKVGRMSKADVHIFQMLQQLFSRGASKFTMVLFTHGDNLGGRSIEEKIKSNACVSELVTMCDNRFCVFDNKERKSRRQVQNLMDKMHEMITGNGGKHYTSGMFNMAKMFITEAERSQHENQGINQAPRENAQRQREPYIKKKSRKFFCCCLSSTSDSDDEERVHLLSVQ